MADIYSSSANFWAALGSVGSFLATVVLIFVGRSQIISLREENIKGRTIEACEKYDSDPILHECLGKLFEYRRGKLPVADPKDLKIYLASVLNYFDGIAIGVDQGIYDSSIVRDHLKDIITSHVRDYLGSKDDAKNFGVDSDNYRHLMHLYSTWTTPTTTYKRRWWSSSRNGRN